MIVAWRSSRRGRKQGPERAAIEGRRVLVASGVLARKSIRQIAAELAALPEDERPSQCSVATVGRDVLALRAEWARQRQEALEVVMAEELARLNALEAAVWPQAMEGSGEAVDRCLAIQRQRLLLSGRGQGGASGVGVLQAPLPGPGGVMEIRVTYVDDWREAIAAANGVLTAPAEEAAEGEME